MQIVYIFSLAFDDGAGEMAAVDVTEMHTLVEGWAEQVGGTYVASILGDTTIFLVDMEEVLPTGLFRVS